MSTAVSIQQCARLLLSADDILVVAHTSPDGDTIGSSHALCFALRRAGKRARVACADPFPQRYGYLADGASEGDFEPAFIVAADIAEAHLMGETLMAAYPFVNLCIDHHISNTGYAEHTLLDPGAAATCEIMARVIERMEVPIDAAVAACLYTGLATDTGCFRYPNTTPATLRCAAAMIERGAPSGFINKLLFETVTAARVSLEKAALASLELLADGELAVVAITRKMLADAGAGESDLEGIASLPARIEGVRAGITFKEKNPGFFKVSMRTNGSFNASAICRQFGGGWHVNAAGCELSGTFDEVRAQFVPAVAAALEAFRAAGGERAQH